MVVGLTLSQDPGYVAGAGAGNGLTPLVGRGKAASMQVFDGDDNVGSRTEQNDPQRMPTVALSWAGIGRIRLWRCLGCSTEYEVCHCFSFAFDFREESQKPSHSAFEAQCRVTRGYNPPSRCVACFNVAVSHPGLLATTLGGATRFLVSSCRFNNLTFHSTGFGLWSQYRITDSKVSEGNYRVLFFNST